MRGALAVALAVGIATAAQAARAQDGGMDGGVPRADADAAVDAAGVSADASASPDASAAPPLDAGVPSATAASPDAGSPDAGAAPSHAVHHAPAHPYVEVVVPPSNAVRHALHHGIHVHIHAAGVAHGPAGSAPPASPGTPGESESESQGETSASAGPPGGTSHATHGHGHGGGGGGEGLTFFGKLDGAYQVRVDGLSNIPLEPLLHVYPADLHENYWADQWFRVGAHFGLRPPIEVVGQIDLFSGVLLGETTQGVTAAKRPRATYSAFPGVEPRELYLDWHSPIGLFRGGLTTEQWGLGIVANDGDHEPVFGDYHYGDRVLRVAFGAKPFGALSPITVELAGDLVFDDITADIRKGDHAYQGVLAAYWERDQRTVGLYGVYRAQQSPVAGLPSDSARDDRLDVGILDMYARSHWSDPGGGKVVAALECAGVLGTTTITRTVDRTTDSVRELMCAAQLGRKSDPFDVMLEGGYASGDSNTEDGVQRRATMDPDHHVGLILFPEVMGFMTARSATLAQASATFARPSPGSDLVPTNGGVAGAIYLFPWLTVRPSSLIETRLGAVWAVASTDVVDPYRQRAESRSVNYRGGDPRNRDLGLELDGSFLLHGTLSSGIGLEGGLEGGVLFPGHAFDDAAGHTMKPVALGRVRLGMHF